MSARHLIACEYPPQVGGVGDYTRLVAEGLAAAGEEVSVWCPDAPEGVAEAQVSTGVEVRREFGSFSPKDLARVGRLLDVHAAPRRLLVQYVPHGYGWRSLNLAFCLWLWARAALKGDRVEVMVHEPGVAFGEGTRKQDAAAVVHRAMAAALLRAASRVFVSTPAWEQYWRPYALGRDVEFEWLPVPSTVPLDEDSGLTARVRALYRPASGGLLLGHLGTYSTHTARYLLRLLPALLSEKAAASVLLVGRGGERVREEIVSSHPSLAGRLGAAGRLAPRELSAHLSACDLMLQPFPDGVSTRRTSVMAALAHGLPVVTTRGRLTEGLWEESGAVALAPAEDFAALGELTARLLSDARERSRLADAARALYRERFDLSHTVNALRRERPARGVAAETLFAGAKN